MTTTPTERSVEVTHKILGNIELILIEKRLDGSDIADIWERLNPTIEHTLHQELQKARAEMLHKLHLCAIGKYEGDALENVKAQIKEYQSELDQDK